MDVGAFRKHRVEVRGYHNMWSDGNTWPLADHIPNAIDSHVRESRLFERGLHGSGASAFVKRRRRNLTNTNLIAYHFGLARFDGVECAAHGWESDQIGNFVGVCPRGRQYDGCENNEPRRANRARDHSTDGTAIQTTEERSNIVKKMLHRCAARAKGAIDNGQTAH